jgi:hypothetical protein
MRNLIISAFIIAIVTAAVFSQARAYDFVNYKDPQYVTENETVQQGLSGEGIRWAFTTFETGSWMPVTWLSYMLDATVFGSNPAGFHLINVLIHLASALLLLFLLNELFKNAWVARLGALVFAVHPLNVEPVMWISARRDLLSLFFGLAAMLAYLSYGRKLSIGGYALVTLLFLVALMSNSMIITLPIILLMFDMWPLNRWKTNEPAQKTRLLLEKLPWFAMSIAFLFIKLSANGNVPAPMEPLPLGYRIGHGIMNYGVYIGGLLNPRNLIPHHPSYGLDIQLATLAFSLVFIACVSLGAWRLRKKNPSVAFGWGWYLLTMSPVVGLFPLGDHSIAERYMYLPLIGAIIMAIGLITVRVDQNRILSIIFPIGTVLVVAWFSSISWRQAAVWRNTTTLFEHTLAIEKDNIIGHTHLGIAQLRDTNTFQNGVEHLEFAANYFRESSVPHPPASVIFENLGAAHLVKLEFGPAISVLQEALYHDLQNGNAHRNIAFAYWQLQKLFPAREHCLRALDINPVDAEAGELLQLLFP